MNLDAMPAQRQMSTGEETLATESTGWTLRSASARLGSVHHWYRATFPRSDFRLVGLTGPGHDPHHGI